MQAPTKCSLRTALIVAALLIPGGCIAMFTVALVRGAMRAYNEKTPAAPMADAAP
jgi:hypothetical protein